jgi:uncharacterized repeat protein (TIGR01451 family)
MSRRKVKFTKRLSVRLTALGAVLALGAIAIAGSSGWLPTGGPPEPEQESDSGVESSQVELPQPIPAIDDLELAGTPASPIPPPGSDGQSPENDSRFAPAEQAYAAPVFSMPSPNETVIRGNDGGDVVQASAEEPVEPPASIYARNGGFAAVPTPPATNTLSFPSAAAQEADMPEPTESGDSSTPRPALLVSAAGDVPPTTNDPALPADAPTWPVPEPPAAPTPEANSAWGGAAPAAQHAAPDDSTPATAEDEPAFAAPAARFAPPQFDAPAADAPRALSAEAPRALSGFGSPAYDDPAYDNQPTSDAPAQLPSEASSAMNGFAARSDSDPAARGLASDNGLAPAGSYEGDGVPGAEAIEGVQTPSLTIHKSAPAEIQVGKETEFQILVTNSGNVAAHDVVIFDRVPRGTRFVSAQPAATRTPEGLLMWEAGTLQPGDQRSIAVQLLPIAEGEIGSVAQVLFQSQASVRTICTKPELTITHTAPQKVLIGESLTLDIEINNPGTGAATNVVLEADVPEGLVHAAGRELEREIGTLRPGDSRQLQLTLTADKPGLVQNRVLVQADGNVIAEHVLEIEVVAPALQVSLSGPKLRYLDRPATYDVAVANPGTAPAREVELVTYLPAGMKFVSADQKGTYEPQNHAVYWSLEELPANESGAAKLTLLPLEIGQQTISLEARAERGLQHADQRTVQVDSLAELQFTIVDEHDPIEIGADTTYVVTLTNRGSSAASNIQLSVSLPAQLQAVGGDGPTRVLVEDGRMAIDPLARLGAGEQAVYRIRVQGLEAGPQRLQVQLLTAETPVPVTKEEITHVYADE